ncbi:Flagellar biosynthesis protein FliR [hydrothermal vent metagenome]|uniref:Flagellar biosynthesis protein FliR n=1 Tax=hydrothermal vent metagenome TaxID=652676 RepID=A0A1W1C5P2_9ZZZZ
MLSFVSFLQSGNVIAFILLFFRFGGLFIAAPIFSHTTIPPKFKVAMAFFFSVIFFESVPPLNIPINVASIIMAILSELLFGLVIGLALQLAYNVITFAGGIISFMMGFSMATAIDPQNGVSMPIVSQFLSLIALMVLFSLNLHHWLILYIDHSLAHIPLGGFLITKHIISYTVKAAGNMFLVGFMIAFPIVALSLLADLIFGMLMKTMPQFNLLVIGFPIKIMVSFAVLIATLATVVLLLKGEVIDAFNSLELFF